MWEAELDEADLRARLSRGRFSRRPIPRDAHRLAKRLGTRRPSQPRRPDAAGDFRPGPARRRGAHARLATHQEHGVRAAPAEAAVYRFSGHGSGHGVGLCVIGSTNLAARGVGAPGDSGEILSQARYRHTSASTGAGRLGAARRARLAPRRRRRRARRHREPDDTGAGRAVEHARRSAACENHASLSSDDRRLRARDRAVVVHLRRVGQTGANCTCCRSPSCANAACWSARFGTSSCTRWPTTFSGNVRRGCAKARRSTLPGRDRFLARRRRAAPRVRSLAPPAQRTTNCCVRYRSAR